MKTYILVLIIALFSAHVISQTYDYKRKYTDPNRSSTDYFGNAVDVENNYLVATNTGDFEDASESNPLDSAGSALIYIKVNNEWVINQKISAYDRVVGDAFGTAAKMQGDELFISAVFNASDSLSNNPLLESGAVYVYKRNGLGQYMPTQKIVAFDRNGNENYGKSIDVHGEWLVIGAIYEDKDANGASVLGSKPGAAYVYRKNTGNGNWDFFQKLSHVSRNDLDRFGFSCAVYNNQIAIGAYSHDFDLAETTPILDAGAVYTYSFNGTSWVYQAKLIRGSRTQGDSFGYALDINEDKMVIAAPFKTLNGGNNNRGALNIYKLVGNNWVSNQTSILYPRAAENFPADFNRIGNFGFSISMKHDAFFVSAPEESRFLPSPAMTSYGAVFRYELSGSTYTLTYTQEYLAPEKHEYATFGFSLAVDSNVLIVGAPGENKDSLDQIPLLDSAGAFYIYEQCIQANVPQLSPSISICQGDSVQLIVNTSSQLNSAKDWYWYTGTYATGTLVDSTDTIWVSPTTTTTYSVAGEGFCVGANLSDSVGMVTVNVNSNPTVTINASPGTSICEGESLTLSGSGASTYVWDNGVVDGTSFTPTATTTYKVVGTDLNGCKDSLNQLITLISPPTVGINYSGNNTICSGTSVTLSGTGATTYTWDNGVSDGVAFTPLTSATYTVIGGNGTCNGTDNITIAVVAGPTVTASSSVTTVCAGTTVTLSASGADSYSWNSGLGAGQTHTVSPTVTTKYIVTGTETATTCTDVDSVTVTVNTLPSVQANAAPNDSLCLGESLALTGSGANTYTWNNGVTDGDVFTPALGSVNYEVTGTDLNNCTNTAVINIRVFSLPTITASVLPSGNICSGDQVILSGLGGVSYVWDSSGVDIGIVDGTSFTPSVGSNNFTVTGTDVNGCSGTAVQSVAVNPLPTVGISSSAGGQALCEGDSLQLSATGNAQSFSWDNGVTDGVYFTPTIGTTIFTVSATSANQCIATAMVSVLVNSKDDATITPVLPLCRGEEIQTLVTQTPGGIWQGIGMNAATGEFDPSIAGEGMHEIVYTSSGTCEDSDTIYIEVYTELIVNAIEDSVCFGDSDGEIGVTVVQGALPYNYLWGAGETTSVLSDLGEGIYGVEVRDANNCKEELEVSVYLTENCDYHEFLPNVFSPNGDGLNDVFYVRGKGFESLSLIIFDRWGNTVFETTDKDIGWDGTKGGKKLNSDVYVYRLEIVYYTGEVVEREGNVLLAF
jgi:gliding motility-associated-like protein